MVVISLGTNLGDRLGNLRKAVELLKSRCLRCVRLSIVLETTAILPEGAPCSWNKPYLNMVISGETQLSPKELLLELKRIEREMGRPETYEKWSPRIIDLDILLYNDLAVNEPDLIIPHPELKNRPFFTHLLSLLGTDLCGHCLEFEKKFVKSYSLQPKLVGVVNVSEDSFSDGGKFSNASNAVKQIASLWGDGASIIEIGAQSSKAGAIIKSPEEEYSKLNELLYLASATIIENKIKISIDTFRPAVALKLIQQYGVELINDVSGNFDDETLRAMIDSGCKYCLVHSTVAPVDKTQLIPSGIDPIVCLLDWGQKSLERLLKLGFSIDDIILDPGIGFGKDAYQSLHILRHVERLKELGCKIMVGHSRKSYIRAFSGEDNAGFRDIETVAISQVLANKVDFLRVHNVRDNMRAIVANHLCDAYDS